MIAAAHLDNFLFLIFFAVAILFQLLTRAASKSGRRPGGEQRRGSTSAPPIPRSLSRQSEETDEDRVRKFLEALGQPPTSKPPSPVAPRPTYQEPMVVRRVEPRPIRRAVLSPLPPLTTRPPESEPDWQLVSEKQAPIPTVQGRERKVFQPKSSIPAFQGDQGPSPLAPISEGETTTASGSAGPQSISRSEPKIATLLRSTSGLRDAIILREIFGPPRSLQPLDLVGNV